MGIFFESDTLGAASDFQELFQNFQASVCGPSLGEAQTREEQQGPGRNELKPTKQRRGA